jgi:nicotinamide-nucleotide amidase
LSKFAPLEGDLSDTQAGGSGTQSTAGSDLRIHGLSSTDLEKLLRQIEPASGTNFSVIDCYPDLILRVTIAQGDQGGLSRLRARLRELLGDHWYGDGAETMEEVIGSLLLAKQQTLALAESCTGGYISHRITRIAGSSAYYYGGAVTYSNEAKVLFLGVRRETLERHGAVSRETALEMSRGIRERTRASFALGVTGVAGPSGGSPEKPVGTVWISLAGERTHEARRFLFHGDREQIILASSQAALDWLRRSLL